MADFHKPIPTTYNETTYRSRLEARWALFFDQLGFLVSYEPFRIENNGASWVPDFYIMHGIDPGDGDGGILIEIKPSMPNDEYLKYLQNIRDLDRSEILILIGSPDYCIIGVHLRTVRQTVDGGHNKYGIAEKVVLLQCADCGIYYPAPFISDFDGAWDMGHGCPLAFGKPRQVSDVLNFVKSYRFDLENPIGK